MSTQTHPNTYDQRNMKCSIEERNRGCKESKNYQTDTKHINEKENILLKGKLSGFERTPQPTVTITQKNRS